MSTQVIPDSTHMDMFEQVSRACARVCVCVADLLREVRCSCVYVLSPSGRPPVLLLPGEEPASHVPAVERHLQQVRPRTRTREALGAGRLTSHLLSPSPRLEDEERLRVLVMMAAQELANGISYSGHVYAMTRAGRHLTPAGDLQEVFGGIEQVGAGFLVAQRLPESIGV